MSSFLFDDYLAETSYEHHAIEGLSKTKTKHLWADNMSNDEDENPEPRA